MKWWVYVVIIWASLWLMARWQVSRRWAKARNFKPKLKINKNSLASARFADDRDLSRAGMFRSKGWRLGFTRSGKVLRYRGPGHLLLIAPPRSGKAVTVVVPALLDRCRASRIIIDPKGELTAITAEFAKSFSRVVVLDPFKTLEKLNIKGLTTVGFNPMSALDPNSLSFGGDVDSLADAIVLHESGSENGAHFADSARQLIAVIIRVLMKYGRQEQQNLLAVREALGDVFAFARQYVSSGDPFVRQSLERYAKAGAEDSRELQSIISTAVTQTAFVAIEGIADSLIGVSGLSFADLKREPMTVFIVLPLDKLSTCGKWFRICIASALCELMKAGPGGLPVLVVIDEFFSIGPLKSLQAAMSQAAGAAGLQIWSILQDLSQLESMYPHQGWRTFLANSAVKIFFGGHDLETSKYISELCGEREVIVPSRSLREDRTQEIGGMYDVEISESMGTTWQPLIQPHEVRRLADDEMIIIAEKVGGPIFAKRKPYFRIPELRGLYRPNPYWKGGKN